MIDEGIAIIGLSEVSSNWIKIPIEENIYNRTGEWLKKIRISTSYNRVSNYDGPFQTAGTAIMVVHEVSGRVVARGQEFRILGRCSLILMQLNINVRTIIITIYWPTVRDSSGGSYIQQLKAFAIMKIQSDPSTQFWVDLNTETLKWKHQGEKDVLMGYWNSE